MKSAVGFNPCGRPPHQPPPSRAPSGWRCAALLSPAPAAGCKRGGGGQSPPPLRLRPLRPLAAAGGLALPAERAKAARGPGSETAQPWGLERRSRGLEPPGLDSRERGWDTRESPAEALGKLKPCSSCSLTVSLQSPTEDPHVQVSRHSFVVSCPKGFPKETEP